MRLNRSAMGVIASEVRLPNSSSPSRAILLVELAPQQFQEARPPRQSLLPCEIRLTKRRLR